MPIHTSQLESDYVEVVFASTLYTFEDEGFIINSTMFLVSRARLQTFLGLSNHVTRSSWVLAHKIHKCDLAPLLAFTKLLDYVPPGSKLLEFAKSKFPVYNAVRRYCHYNIYGFTFDGCAK